MRERGCDPLRQVSKNGIFVPNRWRAVIRLLDLPRGVQPLINAPCLRMTAPTRGFSIGLSMPGRKKGRPRRSSRGDRNLEITPTLDGATPLQGAAIPFRILPEGPVRVISATHAADYLAQYIITYRDQYEKLVGVPPEGRGFPDLRCSPYLYSKRLTCQLTNSGYVVWDGWDTEIGDQPGGVKPPTGRTEPEILSEAGRPFPRVKVNNAGSPQPVRLGLFPATADQAARTLPDGTTLTVLRYDIDYSDLCNRLSFGSQSFYTMIKRDCEGSLNQYWRPTFVHNLEFISEGQDVGRYFHYLEASCHSSEGAWDLKSIWARVYSDVIRDYTGIMGMGRKRDWGSIGGSGQATSYLDRLSCFKEAIAEFEELLTRDGDETEDVFHQFLKENPILIDAYGEVTSKPRWRYPEGVVSPVGKSYVEPDFIVWYGGERYRLFEIERPSKPLATEKGHPRSEIGQSMNQIAEWKHYLKNHADLVHGEFPGISMDCPGTIIIGRSSPESVGPKRDPASLMRLYGMAYTAELYTFDDLLVRAKFMYDQLATFALVSRAT